MVTLTEVKALIAGALMVGLVAYIYSLNSRLDTAHAQIQAVQAQKQECMNSIAQQNAAVEVLKKASDAQAIQVTDAQHKAAIIDARYVHLMRVIKDAPVPKSCAEAAVQQKQQLDNLLGAWK